MQYVRIHFKFNHLNITYDTDANRSSQRILVKLRVPYKKWMPIESRLTLTHCGLQGSPFLRIITCPVRQTDGTLTCPNSGLTCPNNLITNLDTIWNATFTIWNQQWSEISMVKNVDHNRKQNTVTSMQIGKMGMIYQRKSHIILK